MFSFVFVNVFNNFFANFFANPIMCLSRFKYPLVVNHCLHMIILAIFCLIAFIPQTIAQKIDQSGKHYYL